MCLVDLDEQTLEFVEALLCQSIRLSNLSQRATQFTPARCFKNTVIRDMICEIFKVYIHFSVEKHKDIFSVEEQIY